MGKYKHVFFDLDHTLWDYDTNAAEALGELHHKHQIWDKSGFSPEELHRTFLEVNDILWDDYNLAKIGRDDIRRNRFPMIYKKLGVPLDHIPENIEYEYVNLCPTKSAIFPDAFQVLNTLAEDRVLHVITNGFDDIQFTKMESSGLRDYFEVIITSETAGYRKPDPRIFDLALSRAGAQKQESVMIGDNLISDIGGAREFGIDQVFFNPNSKSHNDSVTYEIKRLNELLELL